MKRRKIIKDVSVIHDFYRNKDLVANYERERFFSFVGRLTTIMEMEALLNTLKQIRPQELLEIAVGTGRISKHMDFFDGAVGIDTSSEMLKYATKDMPDNRWNFCKADVFNMPFEDESFDCVVTFRLIRHFTKEERKKAYQEINRVLRKNGFLIMDVLNEDVGIVAKSIKKLKKIFRFILRKVRNDGYGKHQEIYDVTYIFADFEKEITESGFQIIKKSGIICKYSVYFPFDILSRVKFLRRVIELTMLPLGSYIEHAHQQRAKHCDSWVVVVEK